MGHRLAVDEPDITARRDHARQHLECDRRPSSKPPPGELPGLGIEHLVGLQPVEDVVMARQHDGLPAGAPPPRAGEGISADARDLPINDAGELVDHDLRRRGEGRRSAKVAPAVVAAGGWGYADHEWV